jgi:hypothetical protein
MQDLNGALMILHIYATTCNLIICIEDVAEREKQKKEKGHHTTPPIRGTPIPGLSATSLVLRKKKGLEIFNNEKTTSPACTQVIHSSQVILIHSLHTCENGSDKQG